MQGVKLEDKVWHQSPFVFTSAQWGRLGMERVVLRESHRQGKDKAFVDFLDRLRVGEFDETIIL